MEIQARQELRAEIRSVYCRLNDEVEADSVGECPEIPVSCKERNPVINAALGNQSTAEARLAPLCQDLRPQLACPLPIARPDLDERHFRKSL